jgi:hypothetical protein
MCDHILEEDKLELTKSFEMENKQVVADLKHNKAAGLMGS